MKPLIQLFVLCTTLLTFGALPVESLKELQDSSSEKLFITILKVDQNLGIIVDALGSENDIALEETIITAVIDTVIETTTNLTISDTITISWSPSYNMPTMYLRKGDYTPTFLTFDKISNTYVPSADAASFKFVYPKSNDVNDTYGNNLSLKKTDKWYLYDASYWVNDSTLKDSFDIVVNSYTQNIHFMKGDSIALRCFYSNDRSN